MTTNAAARASVQSYTLGLMRPPPDGTIAEGDRASVSWLYQGMDYQDTAPETGFGAQHHRRWPLHISTRLP